MYLSPFPSLVRRVSPRCAVCVELATLSSAHKTRTPEGIPQDSGNIYLYPFYVSGNPVHLRIASSHRLTGDKTPGSNCPAIPHVIFVRWSRAV